jgi:SAM-dependent methyltransferase
MEAVKVSRRFLRGRGRADPEVSRGSVALRFRLAVAKYISKIRSPKRIFRRMRAQRRSATTFNSSSKTVLGGFRSAFWNLRLRISRIPIVPFVFDRIRPILYFGRRKTVPLDRVLLGGIPRVTSIEISGRSSLVDGSTPLERSPHVQLLQAHIEASGRELTDDEISQSEYFRRGARLIEIDGHYIGARSDEELVQVTREFLSWYDNGEPPNRPERGSRNSEPYVRKIRYSECFSIVDGHHRLAIDYVMGVRTARVVVGLGSTSTPLQDHLLKMVWLDGRTELYQPIDAPELQSWTLARRCSDRQAMAIDFLASAGLIPSDSQDGSEKLTYLDVGSFYGWFVKEMRDRGFNAKGVELDPLAREVGISVYGLSPSSIEVGEASAYLADLDQPFDVVSCFSVLHHFALGRGPCSAAELMRLLSSATRSVLFFDTGEAHESWMRNVLPDWDVPFIQKWILENSDFTTVIPLGVDGDARPPYQKNYGRTLFACVR